MKVGSWKSILILVFFFCIGAIITWRLFSIQILKGSLYKVLAKGQQELVQDVSGNRGKIFCHDKDELSLLVSNRAFAKCYAVPAEIQDDNQTASLVSQILGLDIEELKTAFSNKENLYYPLKEKISDKEKELIEQSQLKGIYLKNETYPYYPYKDIAGTLLGFVDKDQNGKYGIQGYYNNTLRGKEEFVKKEKGILGYFFSQEGKNIQGSDLILTVDINIQKKAEELLREVYDNIGYTEGQIIVMDPNSGKIIALADYPSYDPNEYSKYSQNFEIFQNGALQKLYEPGSVFKAITMAIALNEKKVTPDTTYQDSGYLKIDRWTIKNYNDKVYGTCTMTKVLENSINTGAVFAARQVPKNVYIKYLENFGFFEKTGVDIAGEVSDKISSDLRAGRESSIATVSFGQGISITPLRLAVSYCALANGGKIYKPYIVEKIINPDGTIKEILPQVLSENIINQQTSELIKKMLNSVTEIGFSKAARVSGYYVAGKTGTAQMPTKGGGYTDSETWQTFAGFGPAYDPKFVAIIKFDKPGVKEASISAAPIFSKLAKYIFDYWQIPTQRDD
ncbi:MAG TPA: penicillin-binding protein 2 [Candidatus Pacearchaeota archaeon]|nr:penicillin-binding protein 2 [Candidatus Parcubacteria bacterium]HNZ84012.1 penicillin-binding protein 2 [Candidatus Pacearchaeota archaeon]HOU45910.1 penicillin-binding protein 2 [Candidatus Pacearchaeota archaeon]HPM08203.1 penicillin-binding protein 2 [Candidatus Pacearchaeota archaeon]HQI74477.1 penicillin-binding protein 2 [Candidatus Pacearchaeota archaeon]